MSKVYVVEMTDPDQSKPLYLAGVGKDLGFDTNAGWAMQIDTFVEAEQHIDNVDRHVPLTADLRALRMDKRELFLKRLGG